jgi:hypothetical protein
MKLRVLSRLINRTKDVQLARHYIVVASSVEASFSSSINVEQEAQVVGRLIPIAQEGTKEGRKEGRNKIELE